VKDRCNPPFNRQHGVTELPEPLVVARQVVVADAGNAIFVAEQFDRCHVIVDRALEGFEIASLSHLSRASSSNGWRMVAVAVTFLGTSIASRASVPLASLGGGDWA
jgi:hypothetical protein